MNPKVKKAIGIAQKVFTIVIIAITVVMMAFTIFSVITFDKNDRNIFGFKFYIVKTDSMSLSELNKDDPVHFNAGDLIIVQQVDDKSTLKVGDIVSFTWVPSGDSIEGIKPGDLITHSIHSITKDKDGTLAFQTKGTNTGAIDKNIVHENDIHGKYVGQLPFVGQFFAFLKTTPGYIVCILVPFLILILYYGIDCIRIFRRYKREQMNEMNEERAKIEEERRRSEEMLKELQALREQLAGQVNNNTASTDNSADTSSDNVEKDDKTVDDN